MAVLSLSVGREGRVSMVNMVIEWCEQCEQPHEGDYYCTTSADFAYCGVCGRYSGRYGGSMNAEVELVSREPCDCGDHIRHNNGGNYHLKTWKILKIVQSHTTM